MNEFNFDRQDVIERDLDDTASQVVHKIDDLARVAGFNADKLSLLKVHFEAEYQVLKKEISLSILLDDISLDLGVERVFNLFYKIIEDDLNLLLGQRLIDFAVSDNGNLQNRSVLIAFLQDVYNQLDGAVLVFDQMINKIDDFQMLISLLMDSVGSFNNDFISFYMNSDINYERKTEFLMALHVSKIDRSFVDLAFEKLLIKSNPYFGSMAGLRPDGTIAKLALDNGAFRDVNGNPVEATGENYYQILADINSGRVGLETLKEPVKSLFLNALEEKRSDNLRTKKWVRDEQQLIAEVAADLQGVFKFDRVSGQGGVMHHLLAFQRSAREIKTTEESLDVVYPGSGPHLAVLEFVNGLFENNSNLNSVNLRMTEYRNYMPVILNYLRRFQEQGLISDLLEGWNRIYEDSGYKVFNTSEITFKIAGKSVKITYYFRTHGRGGFWAGQENLDKSDLVLIHDLDSKETNQFDSVLDSVSLNGGLKRVLISAIYIKNIESLKLKYKDLNIVVDYENPHENFGCVCRGLACEGMAVLTISKNNN